MCNCSASTWCRRQTAQEWQPEFKARGRSLQHCISPRSDCSMFDGLTILAAPPAYQKWMLMELIHMALTVRRTDVQRWYSSVALCGHKEHCEALSR